MSVLPPISVVMAAHEDSPLLRANFDTLLGQCHAVGGHVLLADGSVDGLALDTAVHLPGADVFALRASAAAQATGRIVALTEDHCLVSTNWVAEIIAAHERHPDIVAIGGPVTNGSRDRAVDRANFLLTFAPFLEPLQGSRPIRAGPATNMSFKRELLDAQLVCRPAHLELEMLPHLHGSGQLICLPGVSAAHHQSHGLRGTFASHFHNGRSSGGLPERGSTRVPWREVGAHVRTPRRILREVKDALQSRGCEELDHATAATLAGLAIAHTLGLVSGILAGPGSSPQRLE